MGREIDIKGNSFIYCFFQLSNICLFVLGLFTLGVAIYFMVLSKKLNFLNCVFFIFGLILCVLSYYGCKLRNAPTGNYIYSVILSVIFFLDMIFTLITLYDTQKIANIIMKEYNTDDETKAQVSKLVTMNMKIIGDLLLIILFIFVK